ncbi:MAG: hypothetical protein MUF49_00925 [Oculatellaceae cyanobacterium Prado106]|nr:hypothetical protein [Oculatellaceae cyanobacterium Prado106]
MFDINRDPRGGIVPSETKLFHMMLNDGQGGVGKHSSNADPYTIKDANPETRIDLNNDGTLDNAWTYRTDSNGDGTLDATVVYSIIFRVPTPNASLRDTQDAALQTRAGNLQIRNSPLSNAAQLNGACANQNAEGVPTINGEGWFNDPNTNGLLRKNFQVNVYVKPDNGGNIATLEFQQDRQANQGFTWAAWFRNDLEIFPGPEFNWNGAMHTEGNLIVSSDKFRSFMISAQNSCLYTLPASQITATQQLTGDSVFQGQFISGNLRDNNFGSNPRFDLWDGAGVRPIRQQAVNQLSASRDSVIPPRGMLPADFALDPIKLQTEDISINRNPSVRDPIAVRDPQWESREFFRRGRILNQTQAMPYVDDTFRADDRYGPKPRWGPGRLPIPPTSGLGGEITGEPQLTGNDPAPGQDATEVGLDGYWERRATREGARFIVGQRLELGDPAGWGGPGPSSLSPSDEVSLMKEPLRPWLLCVDGTRCNEARQRKTLWDNLAAVQATAVYHSDSPAGRNFPAACVATTVHPGTAGTLDRSATFENLAVGLPPTAIPGYTDNSTPFIISDFFRGRGTNGWEFDVPPIDSFRNTGAMRTALQNLARFAGDPKGGTPSFPPEQRNAAGDPTHPYPAMAMWGDFSMLRRVLDQMNNGVAYADLSPADQTTLHTAGCTLGMLAYNLDYLEKFDPNTSPLLGTTTSPGPMTLRGIINRIDNRAADNLTPALPKEIKDIKDAEMGAMAWDIDKSDNPETYVRLMERWRDTLTNTTDRDNLNQVINLARMIITKEQVARDRQWGFFGAYGSNAYSISDRVRVAADAPLGQCKAWLSSNDPLRRLCSARPRYPILYSLFPAKFPQGYTGGIASINAAYVNKDTANGFQRHGDTWDGAFGQSQAVRDSEDLFDVYIRQANPAGLRYEVVRPSDIAIYPRALGGLGGVKLAESPGLPPIASPASPFVLPTLKVADGATPNSNQFNLIKVCVTNCSRPNNGNSRHETPVVGPLYRVAIKDAGLYNPREQMSVRTLDFDLDLMRNSGGTANAFGNYWLPKSGLIYAFREDAVSENSIMRPRKGSWESCASDAALLSGAMQNDASCRMDTSGGVSLNIDPPINSDNKISPKPVDYFADPDRRPHGFRLRNGASLGRPGDEGIGLSFITDNPAYVQGPFNLHRPTTETSLEIDDNLEEFIEKLDVNSVRLNGDGSNFYERPTLNKDDFSVQAKDQWRPSEVLADAVTLLSSNFCDGSIEDGFMTAPNLGMNNAFTGSYVSNRYGCSGSDNRTSYLNQLRPRDPVQDAQKVRWLRTNIADSLWPAMVGNNSDKTEGNSPVFIHRSGSPMTIKQGFYQGTYDTLNTNRTLISASDVQMNMIMVSGIVASRAGQSYGGLHNFPRFIENWGGKNLYISGAFLQLNFSTYATAPFDQENWQFTDPAPAVGGGVNEWIRYYSPPNRIWGYDVGLQFAPAGPVAQRFRFAQPIRSEFYSEPPVTDPYIKNLCKKVPGANCPT